MRTILVETSRFVNGQDTYVGVVYRGIGWRVINDVKDYAILEIQGEDHSIIATHKVWDNVKFTDELVSETFN